MPPLSDPPLLFVWNSNPEGRIENRGGFKACVPQGFVGRLTVLVTYLIGLLTSAVVKIESVPTYSLYSPNIGTKLQINLHLILSGFFCFCFERSLENLKGQRYLV